MVPPMKPLLLIVSASGALCLALAVPACSTPDKVPDAASAAAPRASAVATLAPPDGEPASAPPAPRPLQVTPPQDGPPASVDDLQPYFDGDPALAAARDAYLSGDPAAALAAAVALEGYAAAHPDDLRARPARFLAALARARAGDDAAADALAREAEATPILADYARYGAGLAHLQAKRWEAAGAAFDGVPAGSTLWAQAREGLARALAGRERVDEAVKVLTAALPKGGRASGWLLLVELEEGAHREAAAAAARLELAIRFAGTREGRQAYDALGKKPQLDAEARFRLGSALYDAQRHAAANAVLGGLAADDPHHCEAVYMMARSLEKQKSGAAAWKYFEEALGCTGTVRANATFSGGRNRLRADDLDRAKELLRAHVSEFPEKSTGDDALVMLAEAYRKSGDAAKADEVLREAVESYPAGDMLDQVTWDMVWPDIEAGRYQAALETIDRILASGRRETSYRAEGRMRYWRGRLLAHLARDEEARAEWRQVLVEQPLSWYAVLAYSRLAAHDPAAARLALNAAVAASPSPGDPLARIPEKLWRDDHFQEGVELARMGLAEEAQRELTAAPSVSGQEATAAIWTKVALFQVARGWHLAQRLARGRESELAKAWPRGAFARAWKLAHAMPYADLVEKSAAARGIDPYWVWSIMREESNFNPRAESWANAIGLMQIILPTAEFLAKGTDIAPTRENLERPEVAIELGAKYLAKLIAQHPLVPLASAGYNAGGGAVNKWRRQFGDKELDEFVEKIPYNEARGYAKRVTRSLARYHWLYKGEMLTLPMGPVGAPK